MLKRNQHSRRAFTLVELLTVIGIIGVLMGLLMPALSGARRSAQTVQCASNMRQLIGAFMNYAVESRGNFPGNDGGMNAYWYNREALGRYIKSPFEMSNSEQCIGGVFVCPADLDGAVRSYSMNVFASSFVSRFVTPVLERVPPAGKLWKSSVGDSSHMMLLIETFSQENWPNADQGSSVGDGSTQERSSKAVVGLAGSGGGIGSRFVSGGPGDTPWFGSCASEICYFRHRAPKQPGGLGDAVGRLNIGFADGHVSLMSDKQLYTRTAAANASDPEIVSSTFEACWSPNDREIEQAALAAP